jgi:hypothetical protein
MLEFCADSGGDLSIATVNGTAQFDCTNPPC